MSLYPRDLIERLRAELDRLEAVAMSAARRSPAPWRLDGDPWATPGQGMLDAKGDGVAVAVGSYVADHITAFDPAHVLRTIQAHRQLVDEHDGTDFPFDPEGSAHGSYSWTPHCVGCGQEEPCSTLRALASIYFPESDA